MFEIEAHYHDRRIYLSDGKVYPLGEILLRYFSYKNTDLSSLYDVCANAKDLLNINSGYDPYNIGNRAQQIENVYEELIFISQQFPPYDKQHFKHGLLQNLFAYYYMLFDPVKARYDKDSSSALPSDGYITERLENLAPLRYYHYDDLCVGIDSEGKMSRAEFIIHIDKITAEFKGFAADMLRIGHVLKPFAEALCDHNNYPSSEKIIDVFRKITATHDLSNAYLNLESGGSMCMGHTILETEKGPILCETYRFTSLGAFLYFELFKCIEEKFMPVKCRNCGRWFIMKHTTFSHYCKRLVSSNPPKTCRDHAMSHNFKEKLKNDPIWEIYNRAYKQHYARFMKKKMSKSEFAEWGKYAIELRQRAAYGELEIQEYQKLMRE